MGEGAGEGDSRVAPHLNPVRLRLSQLSYSRNLLSNRVNPLLRRGEEVFRVFSPDS
jgi:hypothetical protein